MPVFCAFQKMEMEGQTSGTQSFIAGEERSDKRARELKVPRFANLVDCSPRQSCSPMRSYSPQGRTSQTQPSYLFPRTQEADQCPLSMMPGRATDEERPPNYGMCKCHAQLAKEFILIPSSHVLFFFCFFWCCN